MTLINDTGLRTLAQRIRTARQIAGLRQEDLSRAVGVSRSAVNEWEHGRTEPSATRMFAIAAATRQPLGWFAEGLSDEVRAWRDSNPQPSDWEPCECGCDVHDIDAEFWSIVCQVTPDSESTRVGAAGR